MPRTAAVPATPTSVNTPRIDALTPSLRSPAGAGSTWRDLRRRLTPRRLLLAALATSLAVHLALSLWPVEFDAPPDQAPLSVSLTEMPPPPTAGRGRRQAQAETHSTEIGPGARTRTRAHRRR